MIRARYGLILLLLLVSCFGVARIAESQQSSGPGTRRILQRMPPAYPEIARRMNLEGTVRVCAVVATDGTVKTVQPIGGSPVLIRPALDAILKWRFAPGTESKEIVELHFTP